MRKGIIWLLAGFFLAGCQKKELDGETALKLLQSRNIPVEGRIAAQYSVVQNDIITTSSYQPLVEAGLVQCSLEVSVYKCLPTDSRLVAETNDAGEIAELKFIAGNLVPAEATAILQVSDIAAKANVRMSFEPTSFYTQYRGVLDTLDESSTPVNQQQQDKILLAEFQRNEDGWRLQNIQ
jgi:hypothetical protein